MTPIVLNGSLLAVAPALPAAETAEAFAALTYTQIRGVKVIGEIGSQYATTANNAIGLVRPYQRMTGLAEASIHIELYRINDPGQDMLRAAVGLASGYSYRATRPDGSKIYFTAQVNGLTNGGFAAGSIAEQKSSLAILSRIIEVD